MKSLLGPYTQVFNLCGKAIVAHIEKPVHPIQKSPCNLYENASRAPYKEFQNLEKENSMHPVHEKPFGLIKPPLQLAMRKL
jgi:hypothetical protein